MKKIHSIVALLFCCLLMFTIVACSNGGNIETKNPTQENENHMQPLKINYIEDLAVDVSGVTAFGIKKEKAVKNIKTENITPMANLFPADIMLDENVENKYYLYKTTANYENGNVEYNNDSIEKVTFIKNTAKTTSVYDSKGNLITDQTEITQDEIPAQINKVYVAEKLTYLQFVIPVEKSGYYDYVDEEQVKNEYVTIRPVGLVYDEYGISNFDKTDYYSSALVQSFIIDNVTGYIYRIEGIRINQILAGNLVSDLNDNYYKVAINSNGTLSFTDVLPNKDVQLRAVFTDNYDYVYVLNNIINDKDEQNNIIYYTDLKKYICSKEKRVFTWSYVPNTLIPQIDCEMLNGIELPVQNDLTVYDLYFITTFDGISFGSSLRGYYQGIRMWDSGRDYEIENCISFWDNLGTAFWFDHETMVSLVDNKLRYIIFDIDACIENPMLHITLEQFTTFASSYNATDYYLQIDNDKILIKNVYYSATTTGTTYYQLVRDGDTLKLNKLNDKTYTENVFILQPINK